MFDRLDLYYALIMSLHKGLPTWYHRRLRRQKGIVVIKKTIEDQVNASYEEPPSPHHFNRQEVLKILQANPDRFIEQLQAT